ncbi:MAG: peptidase caspase catalytic subunit p20, partial [Betaproteobacteria bacterium]|nr:peptidase caspase catalytic subunit p20 [Betaproteobacteria bacterium]
MPIVNIEGFGKIDFPDSMSAEQIDRAIKNEILPMVARNVPSAVVAGLSSELAAGGNPFTKGTARTDSNWKVGDRYRYRIVDVLTKLETSEVRGGMVKEVTDSEVIYGNGRITDLLGNQIRNPRGQSFVNNQVFTDEYRVGRKWTTVFRGIRRDDAEDEWTLDMKVVTRESITI